MKLGYKIELKISNHYIVKMAIPVIFIEGGIGCGKSTLVKHMQGYCETHHYRFLTIQEPVDLWTQIKNYEGKTIIEAFYENQDKYAFHFQMMAYISRLQRLQEACENAESKYDLIICERSLHTDKNVFCKMLYDEGKIDTYGYQIYNMWFDHFQKFIQTSMFVYLKTDHNICAERVMKRQREGESSISLDYLKHNNEYHDQWLLKNENVLLLDGNQDCIQSPTLLDTFCKQIIHYIHSKQV